MRNVKNFLWLIVLFVLSVVFVQNGYSQTVSPILKIDTVGAPRVLWTRGGLPNMVVTQWKFLPVRPVRILMAIVHVDVVLGDRASLTNTYLEVNGNRAGSVWPIELTSDSFFVNIDYTLYSGPVTVSLRADINGDGKITAWLSNIIAEDIVTMQNDVYSSPVGEADVINDGSTRLIVSQSPRFDYDTCYVYPGQNWFEYTGFASSNSCLSIVTVDDWLMWSSYGNSLFTTQYPDAWSGFPAGRTYYDGNSTFSRFQWYSDSSLGVRSFDGFQIWGYNNLPVGESMTITQSVECVMYCRGTSPLLKYAWKSFTVKTVNGIRGDIDGDGLVTDNDARIAEYGEFADSALFHNKKLDFGRNCIATGDPASKVNIWLLHASLTDASIREAFGIGRLMSEPRSGITTVGHSETLGAGNILRVDAPGSSIIVVTGILNGKIWQSDGFSINGKLEVTLPRAGFKYRIDAIAVAGTISGVLPGNSPLVKEFRLEQNYPNPFNPSTTIRYSLPASAHVTISVYNIAGQEVRVLVNSTQSSGNHVVNFDGSRLSSGTYIYKIVAGSFVQTKKMVLLK